MSFSKAAREIYEHYTDQVEPFGMDECWLDCTGSTGIMGSGEKIANEIRERIKFELGLTISAGVSFNKIFAKLGSDMKKPDAVTVIPEDRFKEMIWHLPASEMLGVGRATEKKLSSCGIRTIGDIANWPVDFFARKLGKCGTDLWRFANGLDNSQVMTRDTEVPEKTVGHGITTLQDLENPAEVWKVMLALCQEIGHKLYTYNKKATGIAIDIRDNTLYTKQWQRGIPVSTQSPSMIAKEAFDLFTARYEWKNPIRSLTVRAINLVSTDYADQLNIFCDSEKMDRRERLDQVIEDIRRRFGKSIICNACLLDNPKMPPDCETKVIMPTGVPT
jgi:DNA polymerase-4